MIKKIWFLILFFTPCVLLFAQNISDDVPIEYGHPSGNPGDNLTIKVALVGPGDELYFWWSHIALIIEDHAVGNSRFYDYGIFSFDTENFYLNFAMGRLLYSTQASSTNRNIVNTIKRDRNLAFYTLDLTPDTKVRVKEFAENNVLPENRYYYYHHFDDNCSTRIRDIIDLATDGQFKEQYYNSPSQYTLRDHVRRHAYFSPAINWILNFWMGQVIDIPISQWDDMFLPAEVINIINDFWYIDPDGIRRKLVIHEEILFTATERPAVLDIPPKQWPSLFVFSLFLSAVFGAFFYMYLKNIRAGRVLAGISMSLYGIVFGFAGFLLYFMAIFTEHDYTYQNANMLFSGPWLLAAIPLGLSYAFTKKSEKLIKYDFALKIIFSITVLGILISFLIKLLPWFYQKNLSDQLLMLPMALVFMLQPVGFRAVIDKYFRRKTPKKEA